jgi:hypothetical protein
MQLNLTLADLPPDDDSLWEQLDETTRQAVIDRPMTPTKCVWLQIPSPGAMKQGEP